MFNKNKTENKVKPPIAVQILYAFGFLGLIITLFQSVVIYKSSGNGKLPLDLKVFGIDNLKSLAIMLAVVSIFSFAIINFIRAGKKWALITHSVILLASFVVIVTSSQLQNKASSLAFQGLHALLIGFIWIKNLAYFNKV
jgi:hypothetical protein